MKKLTMKFMVFFTLLIVFIFGGCQEVSDTTVPIVVVQSGDNSTSEGSIIIGDRTFEGLNGIMDGFVTLSGLKSASLGTCPSITLSAITVVPLVITLDWGTGCTSAEDGITRSGKINISLSAVMNVVNSVATFTFRDFVSDGNKITGLHRITYKGPNPGNNWPRFNVFTEAKIEFPDKKFITYRTEYIRLQSEGSSTATTVDDIWRIEGSATGKSKEGVAWTASYPSALVKKGSCKWFSSGTVLVTPQGDLPRTINFGDGTCDNIATLKIGDKTTTIELK
jgi:hypothetical protein